VNSGDPIPSYLLTAWEKTESGKTYAENDPASRNGGQDQDQHGLVASRHGNGSSFRICSGLHDMIKQRHGS
jgi:hypothetical protein